MDKEDLNIINYFKDKKNGFWCQYDTLGAETECVEYKQGIKK